MPDQPLRPFSPPTDLLNQFNLSSFDISAGSLTVWALYAVFAFWAAYSIVATYHWLRYSHASWIAFPAIAAHAFVSLSLMSYALSGDPSFLTAYLP